VNIGNQSGVNANYFLTLAGSGLNKSIQKLGSGSRIVDAGDDAAGVAVSQKMNSKTRRLQGVADGASSLISYAQTGIGTLNNIQSELSRMHELAVRATNGAFSQSDRLNYAFEFNALASAITTQVTNATFNGSALFQTGAVGATASTAVTTEGFVFNLVLSDMRDQTGTGALSGLGALQISSTAGASGAISSLSTHIENVAAATSNYASAISLLNFYIDNASVHDVNLQSANSRIKDIDYARESVFLAKYSILNQSATSMLAQANLTQQDVLLLLR
jgi:flagellin